MCHYSHVWLKKKVLRIVRQAKFPLTRDLDAFSFIYRCQCSRTRKSMLTNLKQNLMKLLISKQKVLRDLVLKKMWTDLKGKITTDFFLCRSNRKKKRGQRALCTREGRYLPAKGATYPRRALRTREGRYVPANGAISSKK